MGNKFKKLRLKEFTDYIFCIYITLKDEYNNKENCEIVVDHLIAFCERFGLSTAGMSGVRKYDHQLYNVEHCVIGNKGYYVMHCRRSLLRRQLCQMESVKEVICRKITRAGI